MSSTSSLAKVDFPRVLVLGSSGRVGRLLRKVWVSSNITWASRRAENGCICLDPLRDEDRLENLARGHELILCLAGAPAGRGNLALNTDLALAAVLAASYTVRRKAFLCSSIAVYGAGRQRFSENETPNPINAYGRAKAEMEIAALSFGQSIGVDVCNLRLGNIAGADSVLSGWSPRFELDILSNGHSPLRSYIGPHDLASVLFQLLSKTSSVPPSLNVALPKPVRMEALLDEAGLPWRPRKPMHDTLAQAVMDVSTLQDVTDLPNPPDCARHIVDDLRRLGAGAEAA